MKRLFFLFVWYVIFAATSLPAQQPKSLFYLTREPNSVRSFLAHADKIDILSPNWYTVEASGLLSGGPNPLVLETARQHHVRVMPLVVNAGFGQEELHKLLTNPKASDEMLAGLLRACKENGYIGFQIDFENVNWTDRDALSDIVHKAASAWFYFYRDDLREWIFYTDVRTFRERYELVKARGLQGFCAWVLGTEDPAIWDLLPAHT